METLKKCVLLIATILINLPLHGQHRDSIITKKGWMLVFDYTTVFVGNDGPYKKPTIENFFGSDHLNGYDLNGISAAARLYNSCERLQPVYIKKDTMEEEGRFLIMPVKLSYSSATTYVAGGKTKTRTIRYKDRTVKIAYQEYLNHYDVDIRPFHNYKIFTSAR